MTTVNDVFNEIKSNPNYVQNSLRIVEYSTTYIIVKYLLDTGQGYAEEHTMFIAVQNGNPDIPITEWDVITYIEVK